MDLAFYSGKKKLSSKVFILLYSLLLILLLNGCQKKETNNHLLQSLQSSDGFIFDGLDWYISYDEVMKEKKITTEDIILDLMDSRESFITKEEIRFQDFDIPLSAKYIFVENELASGEYYSQIKDKEVYLRVCKKLHGLLENGLPSPSSGTLDILLELATLGSAKTVSWESETGSLSVSVYRYDDEPSSYLLTIRVVSVKIHQQVTEGLFGK